MTVEMVQGDSVWCAWFEKSRHNTKEFACAALEADKGDSNVLG